MRSKVAAICIYRFVAFRSVSSNSVSELTSVRAPLIVRGGASRSMASSIRINHTDASTTVGGGAINEKKRNLKHTTEKQQDDTPSGYDPVNSRSHLMHTIEGLDRYPNYLSRWSEHDMDRLEEGLEQQLQKVREQKKVVLRRRRGIEAMVKRLTEQEQHWNQLLEPPQTWDDIRELVLDPRAAKAIFKSKQFRGSNKPTVEQVLSGQCIVELDAHLLEDLMDEELFDVYSLPLLSPQFCDTLRSFVQTISQLAKTDEFAHLQLGRTDLDTVGLSWINDLLFHLIVRPISRQLFQQTELEGVGDLDFRHGYVASYAASPTISSPRERLVAHTDDSEVTLNVCIGDEFEGGALNFRGLRGTDEAGQLLGTFEPKLGTALLHAGRHFHEVTQVTNGNRHVYIMWARSWSSTRATVCPCCWLNRRQDNSCICGPRWN